MQGTSTWTLVQNISDTAIELSGLLSAVTYEFQLKTKCSGTSSAWSAIQTFTTLSIAADVKPNILAIMVDDGRYDIYQPNGGPDWFNTPAINRIANEGVNFQITIPATSQCGPSRATFYTGLYPHNNGCINNGDGLIDSLPLIQEILQAAGYYTGFVGKYGQGLHPRGFDWFAKSDEDNFIDAHYVINGTPMVIPGHISDVYPQLAIDFLNSVPAGKPFALFYFHREPHGPSIPRPGDESLYVNEEVPFPANFYKYNMTIPHSTITQTINGHSTQTKPIRCDCWSISV
jgi:hypothetical protein